MQHVFHLQQAPLDETSRLFLESLSMLPLDMRLYGQIRVPPLKYQSLPAFTQQSWLPLQKMLYRKRHLAPVVASLKQDDRIILTDWASCLVLPHTVLRAHRAIQLVSFLPAGLPAAWQHAFVKAAAQMRLVVPNEFIAQALTAWGISNDSIKIIPAPFQSQIPMQPPLSSAGSFTIGTISRLEQNQGLETLIQAIQSCTEIIPPIKLFIIGDGADKRRILWLIDQTHLRSRVQVAANDQDYRRFLNNLDVCIAANNTDIGFNPVIAHAHSRGLPIVATDLPGHQEMIEHGKTGLLYTPGNSHILAQHLVNLYTHPDWMSHYKNIGPELVRSRYGVDNFFQAAKDLLES